VDELKGAGKPVSQGFKIAFGVPWEEATQTWFDRIAATAGQPEERLKGTRWEGHYPKKK